MKRNIFIITPLLFILNTIFSSVAVAQSPVPSDVQFIFELNQPEQGQQQELPADDALRLQKFFTYKADLYDCDPQNVSLLAISLNNNQQITNTRNVIDEIKSVGYIVVQLACQNERIYFALEKQNNKLYYRPNANTDALSSGYTSSSEQ